MSAKQLLTFISNEVEPVIKDIDGTPHQTKDISKSSLFYIIGINVIVLIMLKISFLAL